MFKSANDKPKPPYKGFPLTLRDDGRYCKKMSGKVEYFGRWPDWQAAIADYEKRRDRLQAGLPCDPTGGYTLKEAIKHFLDFKQGRVDGGKLGQRSLGDYKRTCELLTMGVNENTPLDVLNAADFQRMATAIEKGNPTRLAEPHSD